MTKTELAKIIKEEVQAAINESRDKIMMVQKHLGLKPDGIVGPKTKMAIMQFQKSNGLRVDGIVGVKLIQAIRKQPPSYDPDQGSLKEGGGGGYGAEMMQQQVDSAPEVQQLRPMLEAITTIKKVFIYDIKESKSMPGHKLISVQLVVPSAEG